ncbi:hypothetical protein ACTA71_010705 [Dictyostelium dimigraforme]
MTKCFSENSLLYSKWHYSNGYLGDNQFNVFSSEFSSNVADIGTVFYFSGNLSDVTPYNHYSLEHNNFSNNFAKMDETFITSTIYLSKVSFQYRFYDNSTNCIYCPIGCSLGDQTITTTTTSESDPYSICAFDRCIGDNNIGDICYYCTNYNESNSIQASKNGIQCCSNFNPILLLPIF